MIKLRNVTMGYHRHLLFSHLDYQIPKGAKILLNAPSGTGKTSFFRLLLGFLQPLEGEVSFDGTKLSAATIQIIRSKIGYLSQDVDLPSGKVQTVIEDIFSFSRNKNKRLRTERLDALLMELDLDQGILQQEIEALSGGERQRLLIIILLLLERDVYLLDEPTSALDERLKRKVRDMFLEDAATVLVISHDKDWSDANKLTVFDWTAREGFENGK
jgi:putative ABC transport system ATP-binding protein